MESLLNLVRTVAPSIASAHSKFFHIKTLLAIASLIASPLVTDVTKGLRV